MKYLTEKVEAGVINLEQMSTDSLMQLLLEVEREEDKNLIIDEVFYR